MTKRCNICGIANKSVCGKNGKFQMDLCSKHYTHMQLYGKILNRTINDHNELIIDGDIVTIIIRNNKHKEIGRVLVDLSILDVVKDYKWHINKGYVCSGSVSMHRLITKATDKEIVDHINHITTDNRLSNLRICNHTENSRNTIVRSDNTSGYKGVSWHKASKKWRSLITIKGVTIVLGYFDDIDYAISIRKKAEIKHFGEFCYPPLHGII